MTDEKPEPFSKWESMTADEWAVQKIENIRGVLRTVSSEERAEVILALTRRQPAKIFWPVFFENWSLCDDTWYLRRDLLKLLQRCEEEAPGFGFLPTDARAAYDALPDPVRVFRGSSRSRVMGLSWTTNREIAARFAQGHRFLKVPNPVIATCLAPKWAVYGVCVDRGEEEVILNPQHVVALERETFKPAQHPHLHRSYEVQNILTSLG